MITFLTAYNRITRAYYKNELNPYLACGCFVGNLLNGKRAWNWCKPALQIQEWDETLRPVTEAERGLGKLCIDIESEGTYTPGEIILIEKHFMSKVTGFGGHKVWEDPTVEMEEKLFEAMESTLEMLKEIHISKGEVIPDYSFTKRELSVIAEA